MPPRTTHRIDPWLASVLLVVALSLGRFVTGPFMGDDDYVLHNLASPHLRDVLFAFDVDLVRGEGGQTAWYEGFDTLQRRYVRIVPSALMAIEYRLFGSHPVPLKTVSLFLHLSCLALGYGLLRRHLVDPTAAAAIVALAGLHPAAAECVLWFACQPILWAALASLVAAGALLRLREQPTRGRRLAFVASATAAPFSYEAAVAVPLMLVGLDWYWPRRGGPRRATDRWASGATLAAYPVFATVAVWNRAGTTLTDASYRAGLVEVLANVRIDLSNYVVKILPVPLFDATTYAAIGSWAGAAVIAAVVAVGLLRLGPSRARTLGVCVFAGTLAPSLLTRAAVSVMNVPTFRQLYLPLVGLALLLCAAWPAGLRRAGRWAAGVALLCLILFYQLLGAALVRSADRVAQQDAAARLDGMLAGLEAGVPIVQIGQSSCGYSLSFHANGREVWQLIPPTTEGAPPMVRGIDDRTIAVQVPEGGALAIATTIAPDPNRRRQQVVPPLLTTGSQRLGLGTAHAPQRSGDRVIGFRLTFDRPLGAYAFVTVTGCADLGWWQPVAGAAR